mgnify:CR=1 FL=1
MSGPATPSVIEQIDRIRLDRGWSFAELAQSIEDTTGVKMPARTLHSIVKGSPSAGHRDTTIHQLKIYLARIAKAAALSAEMRKRAKVRKANAAIGRAV